MLRAAVPKDEEVERDQRRAAICVSVADRGASLLVVPGRSWCCFEVPAAC